MAPNAPDTGSTFMQRLGYYILGIALGLLILGWFQVQKMRAKQSAAPAHVDPAADAAATPGP